MCGCNKGVARKTVQTISPKRIAPVRTVRTSAERTRNLTNNGAKANGGLTKTERDEERKKRIQMVLKRKNQL